MNRQKACAELAAHLGFTFTINAATGLVIRREQKAPDRIVETAWNPFASRDAAAELVAWILAEAPAEARQQFYASFIRMTQKLVDSDVLTATMGLCIGLTATPEQITLAACRALGIEVE